MTSGCSIKRNICKTWTGTFWTLANSADPDQMPQNTASDQGLHYLLKLQAIKGWMKQFYVPIQAHFPSLHSETIDPPVLSVWFFNWNLLIISLFLHRNMLWYSLEAPLQCFSDECDTNNISFHREIRKKIFMLIYIISGAMKMLHILELWKCYIYWSYENATNIFLRFVKIS